MPWSRQSWATVFSPTSACRSIWTIWVSLKRLLRIESAPLLGRILPFPVVQISGGRSDSKQGLATGDNPQFVRFFWEVPPNSIASISNETMTKAEGVTSSRHARMVKPWVAFTTGGWLRAFQDDLTCVINWADDGQVL